MFRVFSVCVPVGVGVAVVAGELLCGRGRGEVLAECPAELGRDMDRCGSSGLEKPSWVLIKSTRLLELISSNIEFPSVGNFGALSVVLDRGKVDDCRGRWPRSVFSLSSIARIVEKKQETTLVRRIRVMRSDRRGPAFELLRL